MRRLTVVLALALFACEDEAGLPTPDAAPAARDAGDPSDAGPPVDAGETDVRDADVDDTGPPDAGSGTPDAAAPDAAPMDADVDDAGEPHDAGSLADSGASADAGAPPDAGSAVDAGVPCTPAVPGLSCDPVAQCGCPRAQACLVVDATGQVACSPVFGLRLPGQACNARDPCIPGSVCVAPVGGGILQCRRLCDAQTCPANERCEVLRNFTPPMGACLPSTVSGGAYFGP